VRAPVIRTTGEGVFIRGSFGFVRLKQRSRL
jgi:hypothetical protein